MNFDAGNIGRYPTVGGGEGSPSAIVGRPFPSTVILDPLRRRRRGDATHHDDARPTLIETSPLSPEDRSPVSVIENFDNQKSTRRAYNSSHRSLVKKTTTTNRRKKEHNHHGNKSRLNSDLDRDNATSLDRRQHHEHQKRAHQKTSLRHHNDTLTWRMDPSISLSDFTLTVIGLDDKIAIEKHLSEKKKRREEKQSRRRREKWMVEGLYLDMSNSDDDGDDKFGGQHQSDTAHGSDVRAQSTLSGPKTSKYPVMKKYHLHRVNLAVGCRSCDYFAHLFQRKNAANSEHSIEVPISCLPAIPAMLDYIYHPDPRISVHATTATAIPLRHIGTLLGNRSLFDSATAFLHVDLRPETAIDYLQYSELYQQKKLANVCVRICAECFDELKVTWFASLAPYLMKRILYSSYFLQSLDRRVLCSRIASYCRCQLHKIDREMLLTLTRIEVMPVVCQDEALFFIQMMIRLGMDFDEHNRDHFISATERSLYERCIDAAPMIVNEVIGSLCQGNSEESVELQEDCHKKSSRRTKNVQCDYSRLPSQVKVDLLEYALAKQQQMRLDIDKR
ncbi:hypothetical protein ACHAWF_011174 [Thalassiosira exigua]